MPAKIVSLVIIFLFNLSCAPILQSSRQDLANYAPEGGAIGYFLPKGMINIKITKDAKDKDGSCILSISPVIVPDPEQFYTLKYHRNISAYDKVTVDFTEPGASKQPGNPGLLRQITTESTDETVKIVDKLILILKESVKLAMGLPGVKTRVPLKVNQFFDVVVDPEERNRPLEKPPPPPDKMSNLEEVNLYLKGFGVRLDIKKDGPENKKGEPKKDGTPNPVVTAGPEGENGIYTRMCLTYTVRLSTIGDNPYVFKTVTLSLPNGAPIIAPAVTRALFVKKDTTLEFKDGTLTGYRIVKPSEMLGGMMIPYNLVQAIVNLPTELIQFKITSTEKTTELIKAQYDEINKRKELLDKIKEIKENKNKKD